MSHQHLPSAGTPPESAISAALRLAWRHRNSKSLLQGQSEALLAGQVHTQVAEAGKLYRVINAQDQIVTPEKAQRQGNHLVIVLKGNVQIIIQDFFAHTGKKGVQDGDEDRHLTVAWDARGQIDHPSQSNLRDGAVALTYSSWVLAAAGDGGAARLELSLDPSVLGTQSPSLLNLRDFITKLNGGVAPVLAAGESWLNPNNPASFVVLG